MTTWRHFNPKPVKAWNVEALAQGTPDAVKPTTIEHNVGSILARCEAAQRPRAKWGHSDPIAGDFAMLDGRWCEITAVGSGWRSRRPRYELQDVACPDMPRHRVSWSLIERVARIRGSGELADLPAKGRGNRTDRPVP